MFERDYLSGSIKLPFPVPGNITSAFQRPPGSPPPGRPPGSPPGPPPGLPPGQPFPGRPPQGGPQPGIPTGPPPAAVPHRGAVQPFAVEPGAIRFCMFRFTYVWPRRGRPFWFYPVFLGRRSIAGYRWTGSRWEYFGIDLRQIESFSCG